MAIIAADYDELFEPNLLIPGRKPVGSVLVRPETRCGGLFFNGMISAQGMSYSGVSGTPIVSTLDGIPWVINWTANNQWAAAYDYDAVKPTNDFTLATRFLAAGTGSNSRIWNAADAINSPYHGILAIVNSTTNLLCIAGDSAATIQTYAISTNIWYSLVFTRTGSNQVMSVYNANGSLLSRQYKTNSQTISYGTPQTPIIGGYYFSGINPQNLSGQKVEYIAICHRGVTEPEADEIARYRASWFLGAA